jgi:glycogen synthase
MSLADVLYKIKILEELAKLGADDEVFIDVIDKLTKYKIHALENDCSDIKNNLNKFEVKYGLPSKEFIIKFESGEMGDEMDFIEWAALYDMYNRLKNRLNIVKGV